MTLDSLKDAAISKIESDGFSNDSRKQKNALLAGILEAVSGGIGGAKLVTVADDAAFAALTADDVNIGDMVYVQYSASILSLQNVILTYWNSTGGPASLGSYVISSLVEPTWLIDFLAGSLTTTQVAMGVNDAANLTTGIIALARLLDTQTVGDANATITAGKRNVQITAALTAARVYTLPAASGYPAGAPLTFTDIANTITSVNTATLQRAGSDTINGATSMVISTAGASPVLISDGTSKWNMDIRGIARGGTGATTAAAAAVNIVNGNPIAPSTVGVSANGAASSPPATLTGTWYSGGSATTTKPQLLLEPTGTTSTAWSTAGTGIGVNAASGFTGNLLDLKVNNSSVAQIDRTGIIKASGEGLYVFGSTTAGIILGAFNQYNVRLHPDIPIYWGSASYGSAPDCGINRHATNTASIAATGTLTKSGGAFGDLALRCLKPDSTNTTAGTTGAQTINKSAGSVNFAAAATSLVVTNSLVTAASNIICSVNTDDTTAEIKSVVAASGSFTITLRSAATAETKVSFFVLN